ncbi:MAG: Asp23/Gls24 family envelope stress response protein [Geodermatophilaceae bacterium]|nr:Asp23/Gls24 family envelope stress response protein [Geodermatophilaceae bacterium]
MTSPSNSSTSTTKDSSSSDLTGRSGTELVSSQGRTTIAAGVVQKIAGMAAREVNGVYKLGGGSARTFGALRERIPGSSGPNVSQGVTVEVGETQAAVDIDVVVEYGVSITELAAGIRRNVIQSLQRMTGLTVVEVNVAVDDIHLPTDDKSSETEAPAPSRVQ